MLRLMDVRAVRENTYQVVLDRDGKTLGYEFTWYPPSRPGRPDRLDYPDQVFWDLMDYQVEEKPGSANGALCIPAVYEVCQVVYRVANGGDVELPIVLDER